MAKYICVNEKEDIALYYLKSLGKRSIYRQSLPLQPFYFEGKDINKDLKLFEYKRKENAQKLCDDINSRQSVKFIVKEIGDESNVKD